MNNYESTLYLKSPKLLSNIITYSSSNEYNVDVSNVFEQNPSYLVKSEKINKSNYKDSNFIEGKKNKSKKKVRGKAYLDKNILEIKEDLDFNEISTETLTRSSKNLKVKKNYKYKTLVNKNGEIHSQSKDIYLKESLTVQELAIQLDLPTTDIIKWLFLKGISATINQSLDFSVATLVAEHYSFNVLKYEGLTSYVKDKNIQEEEGHLRAPVITLFGHVDHGKTSLLKAIRKDSFFVKEAGDITQSIGSYEFFMDNSGQVDKLIFLDTPGHEAFISMRERGADITDIAVLVVAADDGIKPQTVEALNHIKSRKLPFIVVINKIDKIEANVDNVKKQLLEFNICDVENQKYKKIIEVSTFNSYNIDVLLSSLMSLAQLYQWKSNPSKSAEGTILDAYLSKQKGPIAQLLIKNGSLRLGDFIVAGDFYGKVKAIQNSTKQNINYIESTALADILCFSKVPKAGLSFSVVKNEKDAKNLASKYVSVSLKGSILSNRIALDIMKDQVTAAIIKQFNIILKASTIGSIDAIINTLYKVPQDKVQINLIKATCGEVSLKDIELAMTSNSRILVFGLNLSTSIIQYAETKYVSIVRFQVIYDLIDYVKQHMLDLLDIEYTKIVLGEGEVKSLFSLNKGVVAGCFIQSGTLKKSAYFQLKRDSSIIYLGSIDSLKRLKDDVDEVNAGNECGLFCKDYNLWQVGDIIECYELQPLEKIL